jgi:hypothetical protein
MIIFQLSLCVEDEFSIEDIGNEAQYEAHIIFMEKSVVL